MLISPPFLVARPTNQLDLLWLDACMPLDGDHGHYPVAYALQWHGGIHLKAPQEDNGAPMKLRMIADGKVVYVRPPTAFSDTPTHPLQYGNDVPDGEKASGSQSVWTDDGCVVIEHTTDIGAEGDTSISVTFYSIYMHLSAIEATVQKDKPLYRKDLIGSVGRIYGGTQDRCHLEIVCDDANLKKLVGRDKDDLDLTKHGRSDVVYGEIYFVLPKDTPVYGQAPLDNSPTALEQPPAAQGQPTPAPQPLTAMTTLTDQLIVGLRYDEGYALAARGSLAITSYQLNGTRIGDQPLVFNDAEYNLYDRATEISNRYPLNNKPAPSAVYELLRFGRVLNTQNETLTPSDVPHWRQINLPDGNVGWVNLNASNVKIFSDADFPHFKGWKLVDDGGNGADSRCDSTIIRDLLDVDGNGQVTPTEAATAYSAKREQMKTMIAKFPSEWDKDNFDAKWAWLKTQTAENPDAFEEADFALFKTHYDKLSFWADVPQLPKQPWHFHPQAFIRQFRMCEWLSVNEALQLIPVNVIRKQGSHNSSGASHWEATTFNNSTKTWVTNHLPALNRTLRKFMIFSPHRLSAFIGNSVQETQWFRYLREGDGGNSNLHMGWYGRGFLQLTNPNGNLNGGDNNYYKYFKFVGREPVVPAGGQELDWRDEIGQELQQTDVSKHEHYHHAAHSAGAYWVWTNKTTSVHNSNRYADLIANTPNERRTVSTTSDGQKVWYYNQAFANCAASVNLPSATGQNPPGNMNGLIDRSTAFINAVVVLTDMATFNKADGSPQSVPENFTKRTVNL